MVVWRFRATLNLRDLVDETYVKVQDQWQYLYRAIDRDGHLIDLWFSDRRDLEAPEAYFGSVWPVTGVRPGRITTDGHDRGSANEVRPLHGIGLAFVARTLTDPRAQAPQIASTASMARSW